MVQKPCLDGFSEKRNRIGYFLFSHCYRDKRYIKMIIVGPDLSKVSETWRKMLTIPYEHSSDFAHDFVLYILLWKVASSLGLILLNSLER